MKILVLTMRIFKYTKLLTVTSTNFTTTGQIIILFYFQPSIITFIFADGSFLENWILEK